MYCNSGKKRSINPSTGLIAMHNDVVPACGRYKKDRGCGLRLGSEQRTCLAQAVTAVTT